MKNLVRRVLVAAAGLFAVSSGAAQANPVATPPGGPIAAPVALVGGTLIDGTGGKPLLNSVILMRNRRIEAIGTVGQLAVPKGYRIVSTEGMSVLPGLWDMHTHLQYSAHASIPDWNARYQPRMEREIMPAIAKQLLMAGITSARDPMAPTDPILHVRERIARGEIPGPTLYVSGALLEHKPPPGADTFRWPVSGEADARAKVDILADKGVNIIKMLCVPDMTQEEANAIVDEAHKRGLIVLAHGREDAEIRKCLTANIDEFEHLGTKALLPDDIVAMIKARTAKRTLLWCPTVGSPVNMRYLLVDPEMIDGPEWKVGLGPDIVADVQTSLQDFHKIVARSPTLVASDLDMYRKKFNQIRDAGAELLVGTDSGNAGHFHPYATWLELDAWVNHMGVDPMEAIRRDTLFAAQVMHVDKDYGSVEPGKYADIIAVKGDPLRHIDVLRSPAVIVKYGAQVK